MRPQLLRVNDDTAEVVWVPCSQAISGLEVSSKKEPLAEDAEAAEKGEDSLSYAIAKI
jgi:hypothetical protein